MEPSYLKTDNDLTIMFNDGKSTTIYYNDPRWDDIVDAVMNKLWDRAYEIAFPTVQVQKRLDQSRLTDKVKIDGGVVYFNGLPMHMTLTDRMVEMVEQGFDVEPMAKFLERLMNNPSHRAVNELYDFLEASKLPITDDGHFLAYKRVRENYKDIYSGKFDNSIGAVCTMERNQVNDDRHQTCSEGLHFCGREYLGFYGAGPGSRTMVVKIDPADVVSIPADHNNMKGRTARYIVVDELEHERGEYSFPTDTLEGAYRPINMDDDKVIDLPNHDYLQDNPNAVVALEADEDCDLELEEAFLGLYPSPEAGDRSTPSAYQQNIIRCANGERRTAGGVEWMWLGDYLALTEPPSVASSVTISPIDQTGDEGERDTRGAFRRLMDSIFK